MTPLLDPFVAGPALAPAIAAVLVLVVDALLPRRRTAVLALGGLGLVAGLVAAVALRTRTTGRREVATLCFPDDRALAVDVPGGIDAGSCLMRVSEAGSLLQALALVAGLAVLLLLAAGDDSADPRPRDPAVETALLLAAVAGTAALPATRDLATWLVAIELATLPIVALLVLRGERDDGGALPLLTTSLTSFALAVVGAGLWVTATGSLRLDGAAAWSATQEAGSAGILAAAVAFLVAGVAFKLSLVPFHAWTPVTYPRSGPRLALLLATVSTVAALAALVVVVEAATAVLPEARPALGLLAVASMLVGAVVALRQDDPVRLLAWSGITQAGWVVAPLAAGDTVAATGYLAVYVVAALTAFAAVAALGRAGRSLAAHRGLARRDPLLAAVLGLALLTLAGLPPGVVGLLAKVVALRPLAAADVWWVALPAVVAAVVAIAVYLRWLGLLLAGVEREAKGEHGPVVRWAPARVVAVVGGAALVVTSVAPAILLVTGR